MDGWLTVVEASGRTGISWSRVQYLVRSGTVRSVKDRCEGLFRCRFRYLIDPESLDGFLAKCEEPPEGWLQSRAAAVLTGAPQSTLLGDAKAGKVPGRHLLRPGCVRREWFFDPAELLRYREDRERRRRVAALPPRREVRYGGWKPTLEPLPLTPTIRVPSYQVRELERRREKFLASAGGTR